MEKLGIEPTLLAAQLVNFLIVMFVLTKLLYKPILEMLEKRKKAIAEGLQLTEKMRAEEEKFSVKKEKLMADARADAKLLIEEAKKQAHLEAETIIVDARKEVDAMMEKSRREIVSERETMVTTVRADAVKLATVMAGRLLTDVMSDTAKHQQIEKHIKTIESMKSIS
jgi:F-type H+-transporting ATPase subunit b